MHVLGWFILVGIAPETTVGIVLFSTFEAQTALQNVNYRSCADY